MLDRPISAASWLSVCLVWGVVVRSPQSAAPVPVGGPESAAWASPAAPPAPAPDAALGVAACSDAGGFGPSGLWPGVPVAVV